MKKFFAAVILLTALFVGTAYAEDGFTPATAPAEITHTDSIYYPHLDFFNMTSTDERIILTHYPTFQQATKYTCGPASALSVLYYFGNQDFNEAMLAKRMKTKPEIGTSLGNMVKFFKEIGWKVQSSLDVPPMDKDAFQKFVVKNLSLGKPILVENVEFGGHWRVIIGYDSMGTEILRDDVLIFADPFDTSDHKQDGYSVGSFDRFYWMWFDHNMLPKRERNQPWLVATPN